MLGATGTGKGRGLAPALPVLMLSSESNQDSQTKSSRKHAMSGEDGMSTEDSIVTS